MSDSEKNGDEDVLATLRSARNMLARDLSQSMSGSDEKSFTHDQVERLFALLQASREVRELDRYLIMKENGAHTLD